MSSDEIEFISEEKFEVEAILKDKIYRGKKYFFIKWLNYPEEENTWEPTENLPPHLIEEYFQIKKDDEMGKRLKEQVNLENLTSTADKKVKLTTEVDQLDIQNIKNDQSIVVEIEENLKEVVTNEWAQLVTKITGMGFENNIPFIDILMKNGHRKRVNRKELHYKCPLILLEYYEKHLDL